MCAILWYPIFIKTVIGIKPRDDIHEKQKTLFFCLEIPTFKNSSFFAYLAKQREIDSRATTERLLCLFDNQRFPFSDEGSPSFFQNLNVIQELLYLLFHLFLIDNMHLF